MEISILEIVGDKIWVSVEDAEKVNQAIRKALDETTELIYVSWSGYAHCLQCFVSTALSVYMDEKIEMTQLIDRLYFRSTSTEVSRMIQACITFGEQMRRDPEFRERMSRMLTRDLEDSDDEFVVSLKELQALKYLFETADESLQSSLRWAVEAGRNGELDEKPARQIAAIGETLCNLRVRVEEAILKQ